ncbi:hypothetical protein [Methylobacterium variabile]|jgi:hypothetical protein|uniref:hypothetical protein n=1 Tax=Methylobacterium variabile TaxID=298794 RepID=UPI000AD76D89|nr:hypothetical protein [Methylobacterium variabile]
MTKSGFERSPRRRWAGRLSVAAGRHASLALAVALTLAIALVVAAPMMKAS